MKRAASRSVRERIEELVAEHSLDPGVIPVFEGILESLADPHAPTAVRDPQEGVDVHLADSLSVLTIEELPGIRRIADIGSGCGIPGLVLAAVMPSVEVVAIDSVGRKCAFIESAAELAGLRNVTTANCRVEELTDSRGAFGLVTARAVAPLPVLVEYAAPILGEEGIFVAWKGDPDAAEVEAGDRAASVVGLTPRAPVEVTPWPAGGTRRLFVFDRTSPTPDRFPRRAGVAVKRPLC